MDKSRASKYLMNRADYTKDQRVLIEAIEETIEQIQNARELFENVSDPKLIDYAIYLEDAAKAKYSYLLSEARRLNLRIDYTYRLNEVASL